MKPPGTRRPALRRSAPSHKMALLLALALAAGLDHALHRGGRGRLSTNAPASLSAASVALPANSIGAHASPHPVSTAASATLADALALAAAGHFSEAAQLAAETSPELRSACTASVFSLWARTEPRLAASAALALHEAAERNLAWHAVVLAWSERDPAALAAFALSLRDEPLRHRALDAALPAWLEREEQAVFDWVGSLPSTPESDGAVALVARHPALIARDPELALAWAEAIRDPRLRSRTLGQIVRAWQGTAPDEAARYTRRSADLLPSEKEDILVGERFTAHP